MPEFSGFRSDDFDDLAGSRWRSRKTLGGVLSRHLRDQLGQPYQSWGVRRRLELHIAHADKYDFDDPFRFAKLPNDFQVYVERVQLAHASGFRQRPRIK
jgi:hypothetical protein